MLCPYCERSTAHESLLEGTDLLAAVELLFTNPEEKYHTCQRRLADQDRRVNGRELTGVRYRIFMEIDPIWDWEDSQDSYTDELAAWDQQFRWGDESPGTFFLSIALQRWITMRMSLMQQYFYPILVRLPQADTPSHSVATIYFSNGWSWSGGRFRQEFTEFLTERGFEPMEE